MAFFRHGLNAATVAEVAAAVVRRVAVADFFVPAGFRSADFIADAWNWREVAAADHVVIRVFAFADERQDAVLPVVAIDPFEAVVFEIHLVQSGFASINGV